MKNKSFALFALSALALMISVAAVSAVALSTWNLNATGLAAVSSFDADISASSLTAGAGLTNFATATFNADGVTTDTWATTATPGSTNYYQVTLAPVTGSNFVINTISFNNISLFYSTISNTVICRFNFLQLSSRTTNYISH